MNKPELGKIIIGVKEYVFYGDKFIANVDKKILNQAIEILRYYWQFEEDKKGRTHILP